MFKHSTRFGKFVQEALVVATLQRRTKFEHDMFQDTGRQPQSVHFT